VRDREPIRTWGRRFRIWRNSLRGAGFFNTDLALTKNFKIGERLGLTVGATAFNILNHQNFEIPVNSVTNPSFGEVKATVGSNTSPTGLLRCSPKWAHFAGDGEGYVLAGQRASFKGAGNSRLPFSFAGRSD